MSNVRRNEWGQEIKKSSMEVEDIAYYKRDKGGKVVYDNKGNPVVDYNTNFAIHSDDNGFYKYAIVDKHSGSVKEIIPPPKKYPKEYRIETRLEIGKIYKRYGTPEDGRYLTERDCSYDSVSMPYKVEDVEVHYYQVLKNPEQFFCEIGMVAPNFRRSGKGIQYYFPKNTLPELLRPGDDGIPYLKDVTEEVFRGEL